MSFLVQKSSKKPTKIATWQDWNLSNIPKFQIIGFLNLRLSKTLKYAIFSAKIDKIAHEIAQNRHLAGILLIIMPFGSK